MVISEAGNDPKVAGLVYVAAIVPDENQSANDVLKPYSPPPGLAEAKPDAAGFLSLTRKGIDEDFVPDLPPAERAIVYATQGAWNSACLGDKVSVPAWTTKPSWFIAVNDRMLPPEYEQGCFKTYPRDNDNSPHRPCSNVIEAEGSSRSNHRGCQQTGRRTRCWPRKCSIRSAALRRLGSGQVSHIQFH